MSYMLNGKAAMILLIVGLVNKISLYKMSYFPKRHTHSKNKMEVELDLSNYATKYDLKMQRCWYMGIY